MAQQKALRIAVVGTGSRARDHLATLAKLGDYYRLVAVCDAMAERAAQVGSEWGAAWYEDVGEMLRSVRPDVVLVTVPAEFHHTVAIQAAEHGAHVLCETPMAITLPYADAMIEACARAGVRLEITENVWRFPFERLKRKVIEAGLIGKVETARLWYGSGPYHGYNAMRMLLQADPVRVVGRAKVIQAPRKFRFADIYHFTAFAEPGMEQPPIVGTTSVATWEAGILEFEGGALVTYEFPNGDPRGNHWEIQGALGHIDGTRVRSDVTGRAYQMRLRMVEGEKGQAVGGADLVDEASGETELSWDNPWVGLGPSDSDDVARMDQLLGLHGAVVGSSEVPYGAANARVDLETLIAVRESALRGGEPVELPLSGVTQYEERLHARFGRP